MTSGKVVKILLVLGIFSRLVVFIKSPNIVEILFYATSIAIGGLFLKRSGERINKKDYNSIIFGLAFFCTTPLIAFGKSTVHALVLMIVVSILSIVYMSSKNKLMKNILTLSVLLSIVIIPFLILNNVWSVGIKDITHLSEPGIINDVNQLRGEDESVLVGKILHNKSIYLYKYLENIASFFNPAYLSTNLLLVSFIPLAVGTYIYLKERKKYWGLFTVWVLAAFVLVGFVSMEYWPFYLTILLPVIILFTTQGMKILKSKSLWILLVINFIYAFILNVFI